MIPVLTAQQFKEIDNRTCEIQCISEEHLMERAASGCVEVIISMVTKEQRIAVVCGNGNNGGDGVAIGRMLRENGYMADIFCTTGNKSDACQIQVNKTENLRGLNDFHPGSYNVIVDALFGTGISRPVEGAIGVVIDQINKADVNVISIDVPSGVSCDNIIDGIAVKATLTCIIGAYKLTQFLPETAEYYGKTELVSIYPDELLSRHFDRLVLNREAVASLLHPRKQFSHKGTYGHGLLVAGSFGKAGAAILSAGACVRSGIGLLTVETPMACLLPIQVKVPEAMVRVNGSNTLFSELETDGFSAIGLGPGITTDEKVSEAIAAALNSDLPKVIDADALNILAGKNNLKVHNTVLTPHPKEFSRLIGKEWENSFERFELAKNYAEKTGNVLVLKDAITMVFSPDGQVAINSTGNPGMATGGMGDVLTGIVLGLLAQGYSPWDAARIAVFHHGAAGDVVAAEKGYAALLPSDVIEKLRLDN